MGKPSSPTNPSLGSLVAAASPSGRALWYLLERHFVQCVAPALASHRQTCLRSCVVEVGTLAWLGLSCAVRSQPCRGSVGGRGACDRIEAMLCHRARVSAGFRVRGMMLCHRASPRSATCVRNDPCKVLRALRSFSVGVARSRFGRLGCAHLCAWVAARGLRSRVGARDAGWMRLSPFQSSLC